MNSELTISKLAKLTNVAVHTQVTKSAKPFSLFSKHYIMGKQDEKENWHDYNWCFFDNYGCSALCISAKQL